jgi:hypothetical protein
VKNLLSLILIVIATRTCAQVNQALPECFNFPIPSHEVDCWKKFDQNAIGYNPMNAFFLAKMNELMYPERLDLQLRWLQNGKKYPDSLRSTNHLKQYPLVDNSNFRNAFEDRFKHYFVNPFDTAHHDDTHFYFLEKFRIDTVRVAGIKTIQGFDPEIVIIDHEDVILILFRGTDNVDNNRWAEWIGTDFNIKKSLTDTVLSNSKIHKGFWKSFELIKGDLLSVLKNLDAKDKKIWLSGHSLGGAMAIISGVYLKSLNYNVVNVYTFAAPRAIGDEKFCEIGNTLLANKIHRFEYYLDPVSILWTSGYSAVGTRYWFDNATKGNYQMYANCGERYFFRRPFEFRKSFWLSPEKREQARIHRESMSARLGKLPYQLFHHNTQWLVKSIYFTIPPEQRADLPRVDDSYPFIYYGWDKAK